MPLIAIAGLSLVVTLPALSATQLHAAKPVTYTTVTVKLGRQPLEHRRRPDRQRRRHASHVDEIIAVNHLTDAAIAPGQHLASRNNFVILSGAKHCASLSTGSVEGPLTSQKSRDLRGSFYSRSQARPSRVTTERSRGARHDVSTAGQGNASQAAGSCRGAAPRA